MIHLSRRTLLKAGGAAAALPLLGGRAFAQEPLKVGFVYLGPIGDFGWTYAHEQGRQQAIAEFGDKIATTIVENVAEGPDSERVIKNLADDGHGMIFTTSFGYMNPTAKVAKRYPDVKFEHATGYTTSPNMAAYNARFYEGRAVCGTLAGTLSKTGTAGYIASFPIPEVVMGINAFTLAARKVNPEFKTNVVWVSSWYDPAKESDAAKALADQGADVLAQHTDSAAVMQAAEQRGLMAFGQGWNMATFAPTAQLTAIENHWGTYYVQRIGEMLEDKWETSNTWWGLKEGILQMSPYGPLVTPEAAAAADATAAAIKDGSVPAFAGPVKDRDGTERVAAGATLDDAGLWKMDWYVEGVQG